jgi:tetratricopeptide (TPR) repeat protein
MSMAPLCAWEQVIDEAFFARVQRAVVTADKAALLDCRGILQAQLTGAQKNAPAMRRYMLAYTDWRLDQLQLKEKTEPDPTLLKEAEANLRMVIAAEPSNAEAEALLGGVLGQRIRGKASLGMTLGPKAQASISRAYKNDPDNPRVALQKGVSALFAPKMFGGGLAKAEKQLRSAAELFEKEPADKPWPNWGRLDTLAWLGQVLKAKGDIEGARNAYNQSLALDPDFAWVRDSLLPAVDRKTPRRP